MSYSAAGGGQMYAAASPPQLFIRVAELNENMGNEGRAWGQGRQIHGELSTRGVGRGDGA